MKINWQQIRKQTLCAVVLMFTCQCFATGLVASANPVRTIFNPTKINFEYSPSYYKYEEKTWDQESGSEQMFMSLTSAPVVHSFTIDFRRYVQNAMYSEVLVGFVVGSLNYDSRSSGYVSGVDNFIFTLENSLNYCSNTVLCASAGYGFRYLDNDATVRVTSSGYSGYERENYLHYLPFGIKYHMNLYQKYFSSLQLRTKYYLMLDGRQVSHVSRFGYDTDITNKQNSGFGVDASVRLYANDKKWFYGARYQYWKVDISDTVDVPYHGSTTTATEPENTTTIAGIIIGYHYV